MKSSIVEHLPDVAAMEAYASACPPRDRQRAVSRAQGMMYDAWDRKTSRGQKAAAAKALLICPLCADAFNLLADHATNAEAALELYRLAVRAGDLALGPEGFKDFRGQFWGFLETRPYMRARHGLAVTLLELGDGDAAVEHFRAMLDLNPGDNQGIRYLLLAQLLRRDDAKSVKALLAAYAEECGIEWLYTRTLMAWREHRKTGKTTRDLLKNAFEANQYVPAMLAGEMPPRPSRDGLICVGSPEEASAYVMDFGVAWTNTKGAVEWLATAQRDDADHPRGR